MRVPRLIDNILELCEGSESLFVLGMQQIVLVARVLVLHLQTQQLLGDILELVGDVFGLRRTGGWVFGLLRLLNQRRLRRQSGNLSLLGRGLVVLVVLCIDLQLGLLGLLSLLLLGRILLLVGLLGDHILLLAGLRNGLLEMARTAGVAGMALAPGMVGDLAARGAAVALPKYAGRLRLGLGGLAVLLDMV